VGPYEFQIRVDGTHVRGWAGDSSTDDDLEQRGEALLQPDSVLLQSTQLLEQWLNCWELITHLDWKQKEMVLQPNTFKVLGQLLWRLILGTPDGGDNEVGVRLKEELRVERDSPLRVTITFLPGADPALKGMPWEFLYEEDDDRGRFLATETRFLLTRFVPPRNRRVYVKEAEGNIRVQFIAALPREKFALDILNFQTFCGEVAEATRGKGLEVLPPIQSWNEEAVREAMSASQCHVVHVVGLCRGEPGDPKMFLEGWTDPGPLVDALTPDGAARPQLVILQLCDDKDGDASENFERLAPALIDKDVPAVLAMQYAGTAEDGGVGADFYTRLCDGMKIGEAVQRSRNRLYSGHLNRRFGTPVLYLQGDGPLVLRRKPSQSAGGVRPPARKIARITSELIRTTLSDALTEAKLDEASMGAILKWLYPLQFPDVAHARSEINLRLKGPVDPAAKRAYGLMLEKLAQLEGEATNAQVRTAR
jgi:hypothetical protein